MNSKKIYISRSVCCFMLVLLLMPLGHALMIVMEHLLSRDALVGAAMAMGVVGLLMAVGGIFIVNPTRATLAGLIGGLLFWTGWVEFLLGFYAWRYGVHCDLTGDGTVTTISHYVGGVCTAHEFQVDGVAFDSFSDATLKGVRGSRPEYLIMPATLGFWAMFMTFYLVCTATGCRFFSWIQRRLRLQQRVKLRPLTHLPSMVTFMELNLMMWTLYLVLMLCYDPLLLGEAHPVTFAVGFGCLVGSVAIFRRQLRIKAWDANIRMSIATVIVFWTFVEVICRNGLLAEIWVEPFAHPVELSLMALLMVPLLLPLLRGRAAARQ